MIYGSTQEILERYVDNLLQISNENDNLSGK